MGVALFTNNASSHLSAGISAAATTIALTVGDGVKFPAPSGGDFFYLTLTRASDSAREIVKCTARATDSLTVVRAQEGTTALAFIIADAVGLRLTAAALLSIRAEYTAALAALGTMAAQAASAVAITGGTVGGITDLTVADGGTGASTASDARTNLDAELRGAVVDNSQAGSYTLVIGDKGKRIRSTSASANTVTFPPHASVAFAAGDRIEGKVAGAGQVTLTPGAAVTLNSGGGALKSAYRYASWVATYVGADVWDIDGALTA